MKYLLFMLLLVAVIITAGCVGGQQNIPFASKPALSQTSAATTAQDPVIGVWRWSIPHYHDIRYRFNADGTFEASYCFKPDQPVRTIDVYTGTWRARGGNVYTLQWADANGTVSAMTRIYDASHHAIYPEGYPDQLYTSYKGDIEAASSGPVVTAAPAKIPITKTPAT